MSGSGTTPPEVDPLDFSRIYGQQVRERTQSNGSSFGSHFDGPQRQSSNHSLNNGWQQQQQNQQHRSNDHSRQNSFPLDLQPTLIATAPGRRVSGQEQQQFQDGPQAFMGYAPQETPDNYNVYAEPPQFDQYVNYDQNGTPRQSLNTSYYQAQSTPFQQFETPNYASTSTAAYPPTWGDQFLQDANNFGQSANQPGDQDKGVEGGQGFSQNGNGYEDVNDQSFEAGLAELIRSANASRVPTPQPEEQQQPAVRSVSPFQAVPSPYQSTSSRQTSPFMKPMSPPALIIPGANVSSPAPNLPPIITNATSQPTIRQEGRVGNQPAPANSGGLFPPANPALTGMAGISPIHPNADGPMIFVQPSTPISGLNGARGIWENALRQAAEKRQDGQGGQAGLPSGPNTLSRGNSNGEARNEFVSGLDPPLSPMRPRAKSDSHMAEIDRQILVQIMAQQHYMQQQQHQQQAQGQTAGQEADDAWSNMNIDAWRAMVNSAELPPTVDPRHIPGQQNDLYQQSPQQPLQQQQGTMPEISSTDANALFQQLQQQHQLSQLQAQAHALRSRLAPLNTAPDLSSLPPQQTGFSPTSMAFYQSLGINPLSAGQLAGTSSAPFYTTSFQNIPQNFMPPTAGLDTQSLLGAPDMGPRRRSFDGSGHHASGAGTPGYGVGLTAGNAYSRPMGHRRGIQSEDFGRGWGLGQAGSTSDFLQSITANDGSLLPPSRGRSHSRHSSASSQRSASPALSVSSQASSMSHHSPRMAMPDEHEMVGGKSRSKMPRMKVTSMATEVASSARRTNDGVFVCPIPGCGSTFTRHFNLKGHLRSHNDERPYKCLYDGCPKAEIGFARQHDCKRHMLLHEGLRPFECEGCGKKFARLDALTRHHKSEQGQECAISHPLPLNPDGSAMSESQYKAYKGISDDAKPSTGGGRSGGGRKKSGAAGSGVKVKQEFDDDHSGISDIGEEGGMSEYDIAP